MKNTLDPPRKKKQQSRKNIKASIDRHFDNPDEEQKDISQIPGFGPKDDSSDNMDDNIYSRGTCKIAKEAKETMQECVTEFLLFVTSEASEICSNAKRSTIQGDDIIQAMNKLGFDQYTWLTKYYMLKYKEVLKEEQAKKQLKCQQERMAAEDSEPMKDNDDEDEGEDEDD